MTQREKDFASLTLAGLIFVTLIAGAVVLTINGYWLLGLLLVILSMKVEVNF
jgi:hypothetical protein